MQGSGEIFDFFFGDTFSARVNPIDDNAVPWNLFRPCQTRVDIKSLMNTLYLRYFRMIFTMLKKNTC
jgi:hypothetical protein